MDYSSFISYRELVTRLRQIDLNTRFVDEQNPRGVRGGGTGSFSSNIRGGRGGNENHFNNFGRGGNNFIGRGGRYRYPQYVVDRFRKEGRCFKCLVSGHFPNETNAPCRDKLWSNEKQVIVMLAETGVESTIIADASPIYEQQQSEK